MTTSPIRRMPIGFGPSTGPRQATDGSRYDNTSAPTSIGLRIDAEAEQDRLASMLPEQFDLAGSTVRFAFKQMHNIPWLAGRGYSLISVDIPCIDRESGTRGRFLNVMWENLTDPIITGREELGFPKVFATISTVSENDIADRSVRVSAAWDGYTFLDMTLTDLAQTPVAASATEPTFVTKYMPASGRWGEADAHYNLIAPAATQATTISAWSGTPSLSINTATWEEMPTQHRIVNQLASLSPKVIGGGLTKSVGTTDYYDIRRTDSL